KLRQAGLQLATCNLQLGLSLNADRPPSDKLATGNRKPEAGNPAHTTRGTRSATPRLSVKRNINHLLRFEEWFFKNGVQFEELVRLLQFSEFFVKIAAFEIQD